MHDDCPWGNFLHEKKEYEEFKMPLHRISSALFAMFFSHVATATLLHHKTKITQRYATPALTNIGERGLILWGIRLAGRSISIAELP